MKRDLPEGFEFSAMAPFIGGGRIKTSDWISERYVSLRLFGFALFICRCHANYLAAPRDKFVGHAVYGGKGEDRYWRWWFRRVRSI